MKHSFFGVFLAVSALVGLMPTALGAIWYVSASNYGKSGLNGKSEAAAYGTIQDAVDAASLDDTIVVLPGVYNKGTRDGLKHASNYQPTRVVVDKRLTIKSRDGKESVHVVGEVKMDAGGNPNLQKDSVSGFYIKKGGSGTVIEGVTIRNCAMYSNNGADDNGGAAISSEDTGFTNSFYVCYSTISNCCAYRAGATRSGVAIGVFFFRNWGYYGSTGKADCNAIYNTSCYNCVVAESGVNDLSEYDVPSSYAVREPGLMVNCTIVNSLGRTGVYAENSAPSSVNGHLYNCVVYENYTHPTCSKLVLHNVYTDCDAGFSAQSERVNLFTYSSTADKLKLLICPILGDYRPVKGGNLDGKGDKSFLGLSFIPERYRYRDFDGKPFASTASIPIGAILPAVESASGYMTTGASFYMIAEVNDHPIVAQHTVLRSATYPAQVKFSSCYRKNKNPCLIGISHSATIQYFGKYDHCWQTIPPVKNEAGAASTPLDLRPSQYAAAQVFYVDCNTGNDGNPGTEAQPFKTIQGAIDWCGAKFYNGSISVIWVKPGVYKEGGTTDPHYGNARARFVVPERVHIHLRSTDGAAKTFIEGEPDPGSPNGMGTAAMRCYSSYNNSNFCIIDFTLRKGYGPTTGTENGAGGCGRAGGANQQMHDCIITDCHGSTPGVNQVWCRRCLFTGNEIIGDGNGIIINSSVNACIFAKNTCNSVSAYGPIGTSSYAYHCTIYEPTLPSEVYVCDYRRSLVNSAVMAAGRTADPTGSGSLMGSVIDTCRYDVKKEGPIHASPLIYDAANGDFRPVVGSPVFGAGSYEDPQKLVKTADLVHYDNSDFYSNSTILPDGTVFAGAVREATTTHDVYVDAASGSDSNDGLSANKAKKTLLAVMKIAKGGSTVHAAPGVYAEGTMNYNGHVVSADSNPQNVPSRVVVPSSVTLKSTGGRAVTHIVGSNGSGAPVRAVFLDSNAKISGFTIRGGRVIDNGGTGDDTYGAGVFGRGKHMNSIAEDCVVTGNLGVRGGAGAYMSFQGCVITNNALTSGEAGHECSAGINVSAYSSFIADSRGNRVFAYVGNIMNCVFGDKLFDLNGNPTYTLLEVRAADSPRIWNCFHYGPNNSSAIDLSGADVRNCYFAKEITLKLGTYSGVNQEYSREDLAALFDGVGRPVSDAARELVQDTGYALAKDFVGQVDASGKLRVWNRDIDLGAYEVDRSEDVKKKILSTSVTLREVTSNIKIVESGLEMLTGDRLSFIWPTGTLSGAYRVNYTLGAGARLRITINGKTYIVTSGDSVGFMSTLESQSVLIECLEGSATIAKCGRSSGVYLHFR